MWIEFGQAEQEVQPASSRILDLLPSMPGHKVGGEVVPSPSGLIGLMSRLKKLVVPRRPPPCSAREDGEGFLDRIEVGTLGCGHNRLSPSTKDPFCRALATADVAGGEGFILLERPTTGKRSDIRLQLPR